MVGDYLVPNALPLAERLPPLLSLRGGVGPWVFTLLFNFGGGGIACSETYAACEVRVDLQHVLKKLEILESNELRSRQSEDRVAYRDLWLSLRDRLA